MAMAAMATQRGGDDTSTASVGLELGVAKMKRKEWNGLVLVVVYENAQELVLPLFFFF